MQTLMMQRWKLALLFAGAGIVTACSASRYQTYYIPSGSMLPTLQVNDRIVSDREIYQHVQPKRGDIVVFRPPQQMTQMLQGVMPIDTKTVFVKRVIGLPSETIQVKQGRVYINSQPIAEPYLLAAPNYDWGPIKIPPATFVVLGDNRNDAFDSHYWGVVPQQLVVGKIIWRYWPIDRFGELTPTTETTSTDSRS